MPLAEMQHPEDVCFDPKRFKMAQAGEAARGAVWLEFDGFVDEDWDRDVTILDAVGHVFGRRS